MTRAAAAALGLLLLLAGTAAASDGRARIAPGDAAFGDLFAGERDRIEIPGVAGVRLSVDLRAAFEPRLRLRGPSGQEIDLDRRLREGRRRARLRNFTLPSTGLYVLEVEPDDDGGGHYRLETSFRDPRRRRAASSGPAGIPRPVGLGTLPGGALLRLRARGGSLVELRGPGGALPLGGGRREEAVLPATGAWEAVVDPAGERPVKLAASLRLPRGEAAEREVLDQGGPLASSDIAGRVVLVRLREGADEGEFEDRNGCRSRGKVERTRFTEVEVPEGVGVEDFLGDLDLDDDVLESEPVLVGESPEGEQSNVAFTASDANRAAVDAQPAFTLTGVVQARGMASGAGVVVAVLDTGILPGHPDLAGRLLPGFDLVDGDEDPEDGPNGVDDDGDGLVDEGVGHGTFVAGLVAAIAPEARILPVRVLDSDARGTSLGVARGILRAVDAGAHVVNLSLGVRRPAGVLQDAISDARGRGVLVVVAAGNASLDSDVTFPAPLSDVLAVTAVDASGVRAPFANVSSKVDLAAPGVGILAPHAGGGYAEWSGTSFAAPFASAGAALVISADPGMRPRDAARVLEDAAAPLDAQNPAVAGRLGAGLLDLPAAIR